MTIPAQTNVQLFNQLIDEAYSAHEIAIVRAAYLLAMRLFSGLYRPSGKTFIAHAVGTASVLAELRLPAYLLGAALLHSAYTLGDFGTWRRAIDERKRARVRSAIGPDGERMVAAYAALDWNERYVLARLGAATSCAERDLILIRLANEVDEYADLAALYTANWDHRVSRARTFLPACAALAKELGAPGLHHALHAATIETLAERVPRAAVTHRERFDARGPGVARATAPCVRANAARSPQSACGRPLKW